ncbi:MAG: membrane protein [Anaerolineaceae bacterium]|nr:MAG: membrane protein [Anaerolineaceae bacterium]
MEKRYILQNDMTEDRIITYGGQAVLEGVLMRGRKAFAIAMRAPDGSIAVHTEKLASVYQSSVAKIPFLRGVILLWDALGLGMRALTISANVQTGEDEKLEGAPLYLTLAGSLAFGIGLFFLLPAAIGGWTERLFAPAAGHWAGNLIEGLVRLALLVGYIWAIGFMPDIKRLFGYHGAEHKTINAFEAGAELTPESVAKYPIEHARCGTAFLLTLVLLSILAFTLLGPLPMLWRLVSRILLIPVLSGVAVEYIRWTANHLDSKFVQWIIRPNLALQSLTTRQPDMKMLEVAIASFNAMRQAEGQ